MAEYPNRNELRADFAKVLAKLGARHRRELLALLGDPPDVANVPDSFWARVKEETDQALLGSLLVLILISMTQHGLDEEAGGLLAELWATERAASSAELIVATSQSRLAAAGAALASSGAGGTATVSAAASARVREVVGSIFGPERAANIARNESGIAMNEGAKIAIRHTGVETTCWWRHTAFPEPGHAGADKNPCEICTPLLDTEEETWPDGLEPGYAHVNCVLPGTLVVPFGKVLAATKSLYDGPCVEVRLADGSRLAVTANHPVLTPTGFKPAHRFKVGDHVIRRSLAKADSPVTVAVPDADQVPIAIEDVFAALEMMGGELRRSVPGVVDFHGDGKFLEGQVEVVFAERQLRSEAVSAKRNESREHYFGSGDSERLQLRGLRPPQIAHLLGLRTIGILSPRRRVSGPLGSGHSGEPNVAGFIQGPKRNAAISKEPPNRNGIDAGCGGDASDRLARQIPSDDAFGNFDSKSSGDNLMSGVSLRQSLRRSQLACPQKPSRTAITDCDSASRQFLSQGATRDADVARNFVVRFAGEIATDQIVEVNHFRFRGHVYNLHVDGSHVYAAEGIATRNCDCFREWQEVHTGRKIGEPDDDLSAPGALTAKAHSRRLIPVLKSLVADQRKAQRERESTRCYADDAPAPRVSISTGALVSQPEIKTAPVTKPVTKPITKDTSLLARLIRDPHNPEAWLWQQLLRDQGLGDIVDRAMLYGEPDVAKAQAQAEVVAKDAAGLSTAGIVPGIKPEFDPKALLPCKECGGKHAPGAAHVLANTAEVEPAVTKGPVTKEFNEANVIRNEKGEFAAGAGGAVQTHSGQEQPLGAIIKPIMDPANQPIVPNAGRMQNEKPKVAAKIVRMLGDAKQILFTDERVDRETSATSDAGRHDYDDIEETMTSHEREAMNDDIADTRNSWIDSEMDNFSPDIDRDEILKETGWNAGDIQEKAAAVMDELDVNDELKDRLKVSIDDATLGDGEEGVGDLIGWLQDHGFVGAGDAGRPLPGMEDAAEDQRETVRRDVLEPLLAMKKQAASEIEDAEMAASDAERDRHSESIADNFDEREARHDYLANFYDNNSDRFEVDDAPGEDADKTRQWGFDGSGDRMFAFPTSFGGHYEIWAQKREHYGFDTRTIGFRDSQGSYRITGNAGPSGAAEVFRNVTTAVSALVLHEKPEVMTFSAAEASRSKLYDHLVRTTAQAFPEYRAVVERSGTHSDYGLIRRDKVEEFETKMREHGRAPSEVLVKSRRHAVKPGGTWTWLEPVVDLRWFSYLGWLPSAPETSKAFKDQKLRAAIARASAETDRNPSDAAKAAGNYAKGKFRLHGFEIAIENPKGSTRRGTSADGTEWSVKMPVHYGYLKRTESAADGDAVDVMIGPDPESELVFVVDQCKPDGGFDEHKSQLGYMTESEARAGYLSCYSPGWKGLAAITPMTLPQFRKWLEGDTSRPVAVSKALVAQKSGDLMRRAGPDGNGIEATAVAQKFGQLLRHPGDSVSKATGDGDSGHWVTIDGTHVKISGEGEVLEGPKGLEGKPVSDLGGEHHPESAAGKEAADKKPNEKEPAKEPADKKPASDKPAEKPAAEKKPAPSKAQKEAAELSAKAEKATETAYDTGSVKDHQAAEQAQKAAAQAYLTLGDTEKAAQHVAQMHEHADVNQPLTPAAPSPKPVAGDTPHTDSPGSGDKSKLVYHQFGGASEIRDRVTEGDVPKEITREAESRIKDMKETCPPCPGAIKNYTGSGYEEMNQELWAHGKAAFASDPEMKAELKQTKIAFGKLTQTFKEPVTAYRGLKLDDKTAAKMLGDFRSKTGKEVAFKSFTSLSLDHQVSMHFGSSVLFEVTCKSGAYVDPMSSMKGELELVHQPGTKYRVVEVQENVPFKMSGSLKKQTIVRLEQV